MPFSRTNHPSSCCIGSATFSIPNSPNPRKSISFLSQFPLSFVFFCIIFLLCIQHFIHSCTVDNNNIVKVTRYIGEDAPGGQQGIKGTATFGDLYGIAADDAGNLYVTDHGNCVVRQIDRTNPSTPEAKSFMGSFCVGTVGSTSPGTGLDAGSFKKGPGGEGLKDIIYTNNNIGKYLYLIGFHNIRRIDISDPANPVLGMAGTSPFAGTSSAGGAEGARGTGQLSNPGGLAVVTNKLGNGIFSEGTLLVADGPNNNQLRVVSTAGSITAWSGTQGGYGFPDNGNPALGADPVNGGGPVSFVGLKGVAFDDNDNVYVCDTDGFSSFHIRKITSNGFGYDPPGTSDHFLGGSVGQHCDGVGDEVSLKDPKKIIRDREGFFIFIDEYRIKKLTILSDGSGKVSTLAGNDNSNSDRDGTGGGVSLKEPRALTIHNNTIFVACKTYIQAVDFVPPSAPENATLISYNASIATVQFANSLNDGGPIFYRYEYYLKEIDSGNIVEQHNITTEIDATLEQVQFSNLKPGKTYQAYAVGVNRVGSSDASPVVEFTTPLACFGISFDNSSVCSGHGSCIAADNCDCQSTYSGDQCEIFSCYGILATDTNVCSGHGGCIATDHCVCNTPGIYGADCSIVECFGHNSTDASVCSSHGTCVDYNQCSCQSHYSSANCSYYTCFGVSYNTTNTNELCTGHGSCNAYDSCSCETNYSGDDCELFNCNGVVWSDTTNVCSGHGSCISPNNCSCADSYSGADCEQFYCFGVENSDSTVCSSHGSCVATNSCRCASGYTGSNCDISICFGYTSNDTSNVCSGHGSCTAPDDCSCSLGYAGAECSSITCFGKSGTSACGGPAKGTCTAIDTCSCKSGVLGDQCQYVMCFSYNNTDSRVCSGHGDCLNVDFCDCNEGYTDSACENVLCFGYSSAHPDVCSGHGECTGYNECTCDSTEYSGKYCNSTLTDGGGGGDGGDSEPLPPSVVSSDSLAWFQDNWMIIAGFLAALVVLLILSMCCIAGCLMCCMCVTRSRSSSGGKQIQPVAMETQFKRIHPKQAWNDQFDDEESAFTNSSDLSDAMVGVLGMKDGERTTESSSNSDGMVTPVQNLTPDLDPKRRGDSKRRKQRTRRKKNKKKSSSRVRRQSHSEEGIPVEEVVEETPVQDISKEEEMEVDSVNNSEA